MHADGASLLDEPLSALDPHLRGHVAAAVGWAGFTLWRTAWGPAEVAAWAELPSGASTTRLNTRPSQPTQVR